MLVVENLHKAYKVHGGSVNHVLRGVDAVFQPGEHVGILGRNGAGKTTLLRLIAGVEYPQQGRVSRGMSVSWPLGYAGAMHYSVSGADNVRFLARIYEKPIDWMLDFVESFAELGEYFRMPVRTYSAGMMMRLSLALSLAVEFDCYLVDEVVGAGDARFVARYRDALMERRARSALLFVSHSETMVREYCTSAAVLHEGRLTRYDDLDEAVAAYRAL